MSEHPIEGMMDKTIEKIRQMVDVNTMIGNPITTQDGTTILPVCKVTYGFAAGGSDFPSKNPQKDLFGGGGGAGITITPVAFLAISNGEARLLQVEPFRDTQDRLAGMLPEVVDKISALFKKSSDKSSGKNKASDNTETTK
ncbi:MAG TPA: GerW family sporulation protein [Candidatus Gallacutalibacter stercoravium]|nr:GerW family sporulation protein [Candidatus Gallacutalibacter stercoravium]